MSVHDKPTTSCSHFPGILPADILGRFSYVTTTSCSPFPWDLACWHSGNVLSWTNHLMLPISLGSCLLAFWEGSLIDQPPHAPHFPRILPAGILGRFSHEPTTSCPHFPGIGPAGILGRWGEARQLPANIEGNNPLGALIAVCQYTWVRRYGY